MHVRALYARLRAIGEPRWFSAVLIVASCIPAVLALAAMGSDIIGGTRFFGSNPIKEGEHFLGEWTLRFLMATLAVTPLRALLGWNWLAKHRRTMGLFAFGYLMLHWLVYLVPVLGVVHFWLSVKKDIGDPLMFGSIFAALGLWRVWKWRRRSVRRAAAHQ